MPKENICLKCKAENKDDAKFCETCGAPLSDTEIESEKSSTDASSKAASVFANKKKLAVIGGVVTGIIIAIIITVNVINSITSVTGAGPNGTVLDKAGFDNLFTEAELDISSGRYLEAIGKLRYIPEKYSRYDEAQAMITAAETAFVDNIITEARRLAGDGSYQTAIDTLNNALEKIPGNQVFSNEIDNITASYKASFISEAAQLPYLEAIAVIDNGLSVFTNDGELTAKRNELVNSYKEQLLSDIEQASKTNDYKLSKSLISEGLAFFIDDFDFLVSDVILSAKEAIYAGKTTVAISDLRNGYTIYNSPDIKSLLDSAEKSYLSGVSEQYKKNLADKKYTDALSTLDEAEKLFPDDASLLSMRTEAISSYAAFLTDEINSMLENDENDFSGYAEIYSKLTFFKDDTEMSRLIETFQNVYRDYIISKAAAEYDDGGGYNTALGLLRGAHASISGDEMIRTEIEKYENLSPVNIFKNDLITNDMPAAALVPYTRAEVEDIFKMLYVENLNETEYPRMPTYNQDARKFLEQVKAAYDNPSEEKPFLYEFEQKIRIIDLRHISYELLNNHYTSSQSMKDDLFFSHGFNGKSSTAKARIKLGTDFEYELGLGAGSISDNKNTGLNIVIGGSYWTIKSEQFHRSIKKTPSGDLSGNIKKFVVNTNDGYIYIQSTSNIDEGESAIMLFAGFEDEVVKFQGIMVDRNLKSSLLRVQYISLILNQ